MAKPVQGLQIDENLAHQRREWRIERVGWVVMAALLLAGLLGLFGNGPLSRAQAGEPDGVSVDYERLQRAAAPQTYRFEVDPSLASEGTLRLRFEDTLLEELEFQSIIPEPESVTAGPGYTEFVFAMDPGAGQPARITMQYQHTTFGHVSGRVAAPGAPTMVIDQIVFP